MGKAMPSPRRCAACAAEIADTKPKTRCSKCLLVSFCNKQCQASAHSIHKNFCLQPSLHQYAVTLKVYHDQALVETPVPFFTTTMPPAVITLMTMFDAGSREVSKDVLEPDPAAPVSEQYQAAWASYWIAEYCLKKRQPGKAWEYFESAVVVATKLKYWRLASAAMSEQLSMLLKYMAVTAAIPKVEICDDILAAAEQHQDAFLLASGYFYKARLTLLPQPGVNIASGVEEAVRCIHLSKGYWIDMVKATKLQGDAGKPGFKMAANSLVTNLASIARLLSSPECKAYEQSEILLTEAQRYDVCTGAPYHKLDMLQSLANNCELQPFEADSRLRHKAAEYRRALFVEMANQGHPVPKRCVACRENCKAHKPSASKDAPKTKVIVLGCLDLIHKSCAQKLGGEAPCPECKHEIGEWN